VLTDTLPEGVTFVSSTPAATQNGNVLTFDLTQALTGGSPMTVTINVSPTTTGALTNQAALVFSAESGTVEKDSSQTVTVSGTATQAAATSTSLVVSPSPASALQTVTLSSTVTNTSGQAGTPGGTVDFMTGPTLIGSGTLDADGMVSITASQPPGSYPIVADYLGTTDFLASQSQATTLTVSALPSTTTLSATASSSAAGQAVVFTAMVSGPAGAVAPSRTVTFLDGTTTLGTGTLNASGVATFTTRSLAPGAHAITASYGGDENYLSSTSAAVTEQVNASPAATPAPTVLNVQRFGFHDQPSVLVLTFSAALDPSRAQDPGCFTVTGGGRTFAVTTAVYNPSAHSVTLRFGRFLNVHHHYKITVDGTTPDGLTSASGVALDGTSTGRPGSDYVQSIGMGILAGRASSAGVSLATINTPSRSVVPAHAVDALLAAGHVAVVRRHHH
jgi:hypothetical protein